MNIEGEGEAARLNAFAARYAQAWCSQDATRVASFYERSGSLRINRGEPAVGREAITAVAQAFMTAFPDMTVSFDELRIEGGVPRFHWTLIGTNSGPGGTGRFVRISGTETWVIGEEGLIAESDGQFDQSDFDRQLGGQ